MAPSSESAGDESPKSGGKSLSESAAGPIMDASTEARWLAEKLGNIGVCRC